METKLLDVVENIFLYSKDSKLEPIIFEILNDELDFLSKFLNTNPLQTVLFANCYIFSFQNASIPSVFEYFGLKEFQILKYQADIQSLFEKKLLIRKNFNLLKQEYEIDGLVINSIAKSTALKKVDEHENQLVKVLEIFNDYCILYKNGEFSNEEFFIKTNAFFEEHSERPIFSFLTQNKLNHFEKLFLVKCIWNTILNSENDFNTSLDDVIGIFEKTKTGKIEKTKFLLKKQSGLTKIPLIETKRSQSFFGSTTDVKLAPTVINFLKNFENIDFDFSPSEDSRFINHENIVSKNLVFNKEEYSQIKNLERVLGGEKFSEIRERLEIQSMSKGISCLFYGLSGTGKTESVYQLAKSSKRNIFKIEIAEMKSKFYGESQKLIKKTFDDYEELRIKEERCPILFFNEADAVIAKRRSGNHYQHTETENAIQNIILEELENFKGIFFATTNLVENMDAAFERRFLFKVKFEKPATEVSAEIWKLKLPFLSVKESLNLAETFNFSGGEMENVARKSLMNEIITGEKPNFAAVEKMCKEEKWKSIEMVKKIGF